MRQKDEKRQNNKKTEWYKGKIIGKKEWHKEKITEKENEKRQRNKKDRVTGKTEYIKKIQSEIRKVRLEKWKTGYKQRWVTNKLKRIDN